MINLFDDQKELIDKIRAAMKRKKRIIAVSPTGSGKSILSSAMIQMSIEKGSRCAYTVPRIDLITQMSAAFNQFSIPHSFIAAGHMFNPYAFAHICSAQTLINKLNIITPRILFIDEAHIAGSSVKKIIDHYSQKDSWILGMTASPKKESGICLSEMYDEMVIGKSTKWLIENKRLSDYDAYAPSTPDLTGVSISSHSGDYASGKLSDCMMRQSSITGDAVSHYRRLADGTRAVAYCTSIKHSKQTAEAFNAAGIRAAHLDGDTPKDERRATAREFALGRIKVICNVDLITTGYDIKSQTGIDCSIETIIMLRPTKSLALYLQMIGRGLRFKERNAVILDHAGNIAFHGLPCEEREWTLEGKEKTRQTGERAVPVRQCPQCFRAHTPAPLCPTCGFRYEIKSRMVEQEEGELKAIDKSAVVRANKIEQGMAKTLDELIALGTRRGMKNPYAWAKYVYNARAKK